MRSPISNFKFQISNPPRAVRAFTMLELMVVVAIMGIVLGLGLPSFNRMLHGEGLTKAVKDVVEVCSTARARAILSGNPVELHIHPKAGHFEVGGGAAPAARPNSDSSAPAPQAYVTTSGTAEIPEGVSIEMCDVNFVEYKDMDDVIVRFYPNGTSDEFTLILLGDRNERRILKLEVVTALVDVNMLQ